MPIRVLTLELVRDIVESYGQVTKLNLSTNEISRVENLEHLTCLTKLNLFCNRLGRTPGCLNGLARLTRLRELDVSDNAITSLEPLSAAAVSLERLNVANNGVAQVTQVSYLASLTALTDLVLAGNPMEREEGYRVRALELLPSLDALDHTPRKHYTADGAARQSQPTQATAAEYSVSGRMGIEPDILSMETPPTGLEGIGLAKFGPHLSPDEVSHGEGARTASTQMPGLLQLEHPDVRGVGAQPPAGVSNVISSLPAAASAPSSPLSSTVVDVVARAGTVDTTIGCTSDRVATLASGLAGTADSTPAATAGLPSFPRESREGDLETAALPGEAVEARSTDVADEASTAAASAEAAPATAPQGRPSFVVETVGAGGAGGRFGPTAGVGKFHGGEAAPLPLPGRVVGSPAAATREQGHMWVRELDSAAESRVASLELTPPETVAISPRNTSAVVVGTREGAESPRGWGEMRDTVTAAESVAADSKPLAVAKAAPTAVTGGEGYRNPWEEVSVPTSAGSASIRSRGGAGHTRTDTLHPPLPFHGGLPFPAEVENGEGVIRMGIVPPRPRASDKREAAFEGDASGPAASWGDSSSGVRRWSIGGGGARRGSPLPDGRRREVGVARDRWGVGALDGEGRGGAEGMRSSMPWSWGAGPAPESSGKQRLTKSDRGGAQGRSESFPKVGRVLGGGGGGVMVVDRREREALLRENDDLRRQVDLTQKRCTALAEMQRLADEAFSREDVSLFPSTKASTAAEAEAEAGEPMDNQATSSPPVLEGSGGEKSSKYPFREPPPKYSKERSRSNDEDEARGRAVAKLLACWRAEVLKQLLQRGAAAEIAAEESRKAARQVREAREERALAETNVKGLTQRALAAEAEAELLGIKLARAVQELRDNRTGRRTAEASSSGHATAVGDLRNWVQGFVGRASEGFFEREALLARGVGKLEAFSQRVGQAAGRLQVLGTLLQHKEVQLRNSRAALAADRRIWLLERRDRELAALSKSRSATPQEQPSSRRHRSPPCRAEEGHDLRSGEMGPAGWTSGRGALLEGLRPECEAVMRALFCRVDRLGTGAVRARRLLNVLRSDCGVSELMEAAVGGRRWAAALDSMESCLCSAVSTGAATGGDGSVAGKHADARNPGMALDFPLLTGETGGGLGGDLCVDRDVTWGEFLLFFLPSAGPADDAYNAGLVYSRRDSNGGGDACVGPSPPAARRSGHPSGLSSGASNSAARVGGVPRRNSSFGAVAEDAAAMLQMVVPRHWKAGGGEPMGLRSGRGECDEARGLAALSVGQLQREVRRLSKERACLMALVREEGRLGRRRAEAVHDQYRYELRAVHARVGEAEFSLDEALRRADGEHERASSTQEEASKLREDMQQAEHNWRRRLEEAAEGKHSALAESSRDAERAATTARERISRIEAEHALALRENGKASVRQRALERELARIKSSLQTEATLEREALQERTRVVESKLAIAKRERNALLAALRDIQRRERTNPGHPALETPRGGADTTGERARFDISSGSDAATGRGETIGRGLTVEALSGSPGANIGADAVGGIATDGSVGGGGDGNVLPAVGDPGGKRGSMGGGRVRGEAHVVRSGEGGARTASLSARLEVLALQTRQLLADDSDSSCSSGNDLGQA